jgi:LmbE family N-acetylglucosaminyl deacetylase
VVFAPLAIGRHIDHRIVRTAALALKSALNIELLLYEDMPYSAQYEPNSIADAAEGLAKSYGIELQPIVNTMDDLVGFKRQAMECYASQKVADEFEAILDYAQKLTADKVGAERLWRVVLTNTEVKIVA